MDPSGTCHLVEGVFALTLQFLIAVAALGSLIYKRRYIEEEPKRSHEVWLLDIGKQICQGAFVHITNIGLAMIVAANRTESRDAGDMESSRDECGIYFISFAGDTFLGVLLIFLLLRISERIATYFMYLPLMAHGYYGEPPQYDWYVIQTGAFIFATAVSKSFLAYAILTVDKNVNEASQIMFNAFEDHRDLELAVVMVLAPFLMSIIQYWIIDSILTDATNRPAYVNVQELECSFDDNDEDTTSLLNDSIQRGYYHATTKHQEPHTRTACRYGTTTVDLTNTPVQETDNEEGWLLSWLSSSPFKSTTNLSKKLDTVQLYQPM